MDTSNLTPEQRFRMEALSEKLADALLVEADPANWPGAGKRPGEMTREERGDRHWTMKNAAATLDLLQSAQDLLKGRISPAERAERDRLVEETQAAADAVLRRLGLTGNPGATKQ